MEKKAFELSRVSGQPVFDPELLDDLRRVAANIGKTTVGLIARGESPGTA